MRYILTFTLLGVVLAACSSQPDRDTSTTEATHSNPDIANIAPEERFTEEAPAQQADSSLPVMRPSAPPIVLTPIQGSDTTSATPDSLSRENWQSFTSSTWGVSLAYPSDWSAVEEDDSVIFTSPSGATIKMKAGIPGRTNDEFKIPNRYCTSRTNEHDLTAEICADMISSIYTATFSLQMTDGSTHWLMLSTKDRAAGEVFEAMFHSMQLTN